MGYQNYHIELEVQSVSSRVWIPAPRYWDGQGIQSINFLEISPEPSKWFREENGTEILYWENRTGKAQVYKLEFEIELVFIDNSIASLLDFPPYDVNSYIYQKYSQPQQDIQSDSDEIMYLATTIIGDETNPYKQAKLIHSWMTNNIRGGSVPRDALSTLHNEGNDCAGKAHLFIALLRATGIPARNVSGIHSPGSQYLQSGNWWPDKSMGYHVWAEFFLQGYGWVQVDPGNPNMFETMKEHRIVTSKGNDIKIGSGFPRGEIAWFHLPYNTYQQIEDEPLIFSVTQIP
jgi:transglutaminase-like putative cysteine protease